MKRIFALALAGIICGIFSPGLAMPAARQPLEDAPLPTPLCANDGRECGNDCCYGNQGCCMGEDGRPFCKDGRCPN